MIQLRAENSKWRFMNATMIKLLAVVLMFIDHIHEMFVSMGVPHWLDLFGRPVFPLFLFLAADSFYYTHSKKGYIRRLLLASWCMTVLTTTTQWLVPNENVVLANNAFSTFFVTAIYMLSWDFLKAGAQEKDLKAIGKAVLLMLLPILFMLPLVLMSSLLSAGTVSPGMVQALALISLFLPNPLAVEGGPLYVLMGLLLYIFRENRRIQAAVVIAVGIIAHLSIGGVQWAIVLAVIPMALYNGQKGRGLKNFFYVFYPAHIIALYLLATFIMKLL